MNVFNGLENLEYLKIYAHLPNWESIVFEGLSFANLKHLTEIKLDGIALTSISDIFFCTVENNNANNELLEFYQHLRTTRSKQT